MDSRAVPVGIAALLLAGAALGAAAGSTAGVAQGVLSALAALPVTLALSAAAWWWPQRKLRGEFAPPKADKPVAGGKPGLEVARYLRPENQVVGFRARPELRQLRGWCTEPGRVRVGLVTGDGGAGKTRLALQLGQELEGLGWRALWAREGSLGQAAGLMRNLKKKKPCLLVVDYAETRQGLPGLLAAVAGDWDGPQVRVVLLARGAEEWWRGLLDRSDERVPELLEAAARVNVRPVTTAGELFDEAVKAFAKKLELEVPRPDVRWSVADPAPTVLLVHAAALLAVVEHERNRQEGDSTQAPPEEQERNSGERVLNSGEKVLDGVLKHELRYWTHTAESAGLQLGSTDLRRALAAGCLIGADGEGAAAGLMERIPGLANNARRVALWLHQLYPQADDGRGLQSRAGPAAKREWIGPLRPDPVAEHLVVDVLADDAEELIPSLFTGLDEHRATKALTVLARAERDAAREDARQAAAAAGTARQQAARSYPTKEEELLRAALAADLEHLAVPAASVAVETNHRLGELLADALDADQQISPATLTRIADNAPSPSVAQARAAKIVLRRLADQSTGSQRAGRLEGLSGRLAELDQPEEALDAIEEAVGIYRSLAGTFPGQLATALNSQAIRLAELGRHQKALAAAEEAVGIYRELPDKKPGVFAGFLQTLSHRQAELGERTEALGVIEEAVGVYRELAQGRPDCEPKLANALNSQAMRLADLKRHQEALGVIDEAAGIYRELAQGRPDTYRRTLADVLRTRSHQLAELGKRAEALDVMDQAAGIYEPLARDHPGAFRPTLADVLQHRSDRLADLGRRTEALEVIDEAAGIYRELAEDHPGAFRPRLADALHTRSHRLAELGKRKEALAAIEEAAAIYREVAGSSPDLKPKLANTLNSQSTRLAELGERRKALDVIDQAAGIYRGLAKDHPGAFRPDLADALHTRSHRLAELGERRKALDVIDQAARIYQRLETEFPRAFRPELAGALHTRSRRLAEFERRTEALEVIDEAAVIYRGLAGDRPGAYRPALADALHTCSYLLAEVGRPAEDARAAIEEAVGIWRSLTEDFPGVKDFPGVFEPQLARALNSLSMRLAELRGHEDEALAAACEAVKICRSLEAKFRGAFRPDLADFLYTLSWRLAKLGRHAKALEVIEKAVGTYRELTEDFPGVFEPQLASARDSLAKLRQ